MKAISKFETTDTRSPSENILRGLLSFYLNTGELDPILLSFDSESSVTVAAANIGSSVLACKWQGTPFRQIVFKKFLEWANTNELAKFMLESHYVMGAFKVAMDEPGMNPEPFSSIIAQRFRDLTDYDRRRMPKDIQKSFDIKVRNAIMKFLKEYESNPQATRTVRAHHEAHMAKDRQEPMSMDKWFDLALDVTHGEYIPYESLRSINNLLTKCIRVGEDMADSIRRARDELAVARVMTS